jgi:hypothetical protein
MRINQECGYRRRSAASDAPRRSTPQTATARNDCSRAIVNLELSCSRSTALCGCDCARKSRLGHGLSARQEYMGDCIVFQPGETLRRSNWTAEIRRLAQGLPGFDHSPQQSRGGPQTAQTATLQYNCGVGTVWETGGSPNVW